MADNKENDDSKFALSFRQIDERTFRIFNTKTGRFHDAELGIDVVY